MSTKLDEDTLMSAMMRHTMRQETRDAVIGVLCRAASGVTVIDDDLPEYDDGSRALTHAEQLIQDVFSPPRPMVHVPSDAMDAPFVRDRIIAVSGRDGRRELNLSLMGKRNAPVREALILAIILREAYGKDAAWQLAQDHIFDKPEYAAVRADAEPLIRRYACG